MGVGPRNQIKVCLGSDDEDSANTYRTHPLSRTQHSRTGNPPPAKCTIEARISLPRSLRYLLSQRLSAQRGSEKAAGEAELVSGKGSVGLLLTAKKNSERLRERDAEMGGAGNAAVVAVGRTFFRIALVGYALSGLAMFPAVILGLHSGYFEWEMDRCNCASDSVLTTGSLTSSGAPAQCVVGKDYAKVSIGWQKFTYDELVHTFGCPEATQRFAQDPVELKEDLDDPQTFAVFNKVYRLDGSFQKTDGPTQADESNGAAEAGGGVVAMQVVLTFFSILTYKMLKASYISNGSHCSVGLGLMTRLNLLVGLGTVAAIVSFWWLVEGRFGDEERALTTAIENVSPYFDRCFFYCLLFFFVRCEISWNYGAMRPGEPVVRLFAAKRGDWIVLISRTQHYFSLLIAFLTPGHLASPIESNRNDSAQRVSSCKIPVLKKSSFGKQGTVCIEIVRSIRDL